MLENFKVKFKLVYDIDMMQENLVILCLSLYFS